jgi:hypothetical protein
MGHDVLRFQASANAAMKGCLQRILIREAFTLPVTDERRLAFLEGSRDPFSNSIVSAFPTKSVQLTGNEFKEAMSNKFAVPSDAARGLVGLTIEMDPKKRPVDVHARALKACPNATGHYTTKFHDGIIEQIHKDVRALPDVNVKAGKSVPNIIAGAVAARTRFSARDTGTDYVKGNASLPSASLPFPIADPEPSPSRAGNSKTQKQPNPIVNAEVPVSVSFPDSRKGIFPDFIFDTRAQSRQLEIPFHETLTQTVVAMDLKTLSGGEGYTGWASRRTFTEWQGSRCGAAVTMRGNLVNKEYLENAAAKEKLLARDCPGKPSLQESMQQQFGRIFGPVVGPYAEVSPDFIKLLNLVAAAHTNRTLERSSRHSEKWKLYAMHKRRLVQRWGLFFHRGWARVLNGRILECFGSATHAPDPRSYSEERREQLHAEIFFSSFQSRRLSDELSPAPEGEEDLNAFFY